MRFSLDWLFSRKPKEKEIVISQEPIKPYKNFIFSGNNLIIILNSGDTIVKRPATQEDIETLKKATSEQELYLLCIQEEVTTKEDKEVDITKGYYDLLVETEDFEVKGSEIYMKEINLALPPAIISAFIYEIEKSTDLGDETEEYTSLKFFWMKLAANPIPESRETLIDFVKNNNVELTNSGNLVLYRRIVAKGNKDKDLTQFISNSYLKVKAQKKSPKNYWVLNETTLYHSHVDGDLGNLYDLYNNLAKTTENRFTDNHTKSYDIRVGQVYRIREGEIDKNMNGSCGGFLHCASKAFDYSSFGDTEVLCIVNPMNAAKMDTGTGSKIGVVEMFVACILEEGQVLPNVVQFDEEYDKITVEKLEEELRNKHLNLFSITDDVTCLSYETLNKIVQKMKSRIIYF